MELTGLSDEELFPDRLYATKEKPQTEHTVVQDIPVARLLARGHRPLQVPSAEESWLVKAKQDAVAAALDTLTPKERFVLERRFGFVGDQPWGMEQVAQALGVSRMRVYQLEAQALRKLHHESRWKCLEPWAE
jgi:RNA polymerase sigma factor (sigma-70 family)